MQATVSSVYLLFEQESDGRLALGCSPDQLPVICLAIACLSVTTTLLDL